MNSSTYRGYLPEQIDIALNRAMNVEFDERYLPKDIGGSFETSNKRLGELSSLVVENYPLAVIVACSTSGMPERVYNNDSTRPVKFRTTLPSDFSILNRIQPKVYANDCGDITYAIISSTVSIAIIPFVTNPDVLGDNSFTGITINIPGDTINIPSGIGYPSWSSYEFPQDAESFVQHFLIAANKELEEQGTPFDTYRIYWEAYNGRYYPGCFIVVSTTTLGTSDTVELILAGMSYTHKSNFTTMVYKSLDTLTNGNYKYALAELRSHHDIERLLMNTFHRPNSNKVLVTSHQKFIDIYTDETSILTDISITYIRRPKRISLSMNQGCELIASMHERICDLAISNIKAIESHAGYQHALIEEKKGD